MQGSHGTNDDQARAYNDLVVAGTIDVTDGTWSGFGEIVPWSQESNEELTGLAFSGGSVAENAPAGTVVGTASNLSIEELEAHWLLPGHGDPWTDGVAAAVSAAREGGIVETEGYIDTSNVMLVHPGDKKPSRVRVEEQDGKRVRVFVRGGEVVPDSAQA